MAKRNTIYEVFDPKDYAHFNPHQGTIRDEYDPGCSLPSTRGSRIWDWSTLIITAVEALAVIGVLIYSLVH